MNLTQLITEVNKDLADNLTQGTLLGWFNRCLDDLSPYAKYSQTSTISLVKDTKQYALPTDLIEIQYLIDTDKELHEINITDFYQTGYKKWGSNIIMQPTPTESKTLDLYYYATLPHLVNPGDIPTIREDFHDLLVLYAVAKARYKDEYTGEDAFLYTTEYQEYLTRKEEFKRISYDGPSEIKVVD